jgi:hypothetical protein
MKKVFGFLFVILFSLNQNSYADNICNFKRKWANVEFLTKDNKVIKGNVRDYIIARDCYLINYKKRHEIDKKNTKCICKYTGKEIFANEGQIDHILPFYFQKNNIRQEYCDKLFTIYNDYENLILVSADINRKKSNKLGNIKEVNYKIKKKQCSFCAKYKNYFKKNACKEVCK